MCTVASVQLLRKISLFIVKVIIKKNIHSYQNKYVCVCIIYYSALPCLLSGYAAIFKSTISLLPTYTRSEPKEATNLHFFFTLFEF